MEPVGVLAPWFKGTCHFVAPGEQDMEWVDQSWTWTATPPFCAEGHGLNSTVEEADKA